MSTRTGIFGGAFNPVHTGHLAIAKSFLRSRVINELWIFPTPDPPHKSGKGLAAFHHRMRMLELAFGELPETGQITVRDIEGPLPAPSYTIRTLQYLQDTCPDRLFFLCMGEDSLVNFTSWYRWRRILERTSLLVAERPGSGERKVEEQILNRTIFVEHHPVSVSSTGIRVNRLAGSDPAADLPGPVRSYIRKHDLYTSTN